MPSSGNDQTSVPAFVAKLWHMVSDPSCDHLISWKHDGSSFIIKDQATFCSELLPTYYKHNNMASFIRQLNKYGFHKVLGVDSSSLKNDKPDYEFAHPYFQKSAPSQLELIKRKLTTASRDLVDVKNDPNLINKLLHQVHELKAKQEAFESRFLSMKNENDALWREHATLRQKHVKQQKIVNKLIEFLVSLIQQRGVNLNLNVNRHRNNAGIPLKDFSQRSSLKAIEPRPRISKSPSVIYEVDANDDLMPNITAPQSDPEDETNDAHYSLGSPEGMTFTVSPQEVIPARVTPNDATVVLPALSPLTSNDDSQSQVPIVLSPTFEVEEEVVTGGSSAEQLITPDMIADQFDLCENETSTVVEDEADSQRTKVEVDPLDAGEGPDIFEELSGDKFSWSSMQPTSSGRLVRSDGNLGETSSAQSGVESDKVLVLPDNSRHEIDNHIEIMQSDLDSLREILQELDASSLMGMLNSNHEDSLGSRCSNQQQLVSFNPLLIDMTDILDDDDEETSSRFSTSGFNAVEDNLSIDLNTPQPTPLPSGNSLDPPPVKRLKKH